MPPDKSGTYSLITKAPDKFYSEIIIEPYRLIEAYNGKSAWGQDTWAKNIHAAPIRLPTRRVHRTR